MQSPENAPVPFSLRPTQICTLDPNRPLFSEGHYLQVEIAGRTVTSKQPELAQRFLQFVVSPAFQSIIPQTNWMYPVAKPPGGLPPVFDAFRPQHALLTPSAEVAENSKAWIAEWLTAMSR